MIKQRIKNEIGLTASIGMAGNKFVAKVASDLQKPDGLTICEAGQEKEFLAPLPIGRLWGVGKKTEERLAALGFHIIGDLAVASHEFLAKKFGKWGSHLWQLANGIDDRPVEEWGPQKSISHEHTFEVDQDDVVLLEHTLWSLADELSREMRDANLKGRSLTLKIRLEGFITHSRQRSLRTYTNDATALRDVALELFRKFDRDGKRVRLLGIGMSRLHHEGSASGSRGSTNGVGQTGQLDLLSENTPRQSEKIGELIDTLRNKFGEGTATRGSLIERPTEPRRLGREQLAPRDNERKA
jgi:DNA polymerase-4